MSEFDFNWVPYSYDFVVHLCKRLSKLGYDVVGYATET